METVLKARPIVAGSAEGVAVVSTQPLSLWGGLDPATGKIIDRRHDRCGVIITGKVFVFPQGKGSSTGSAVLMESIRSGTAPVAIVNLSVDPILALGAIVSDELYHKTVPILVLAQEEFETIADGDRLRITRSGRISLTRGG